MEDISDEEFRSDMGIKHTKRHARNKDVASEIDVFVLDDESIYSPLLDSFIPLPREKTAAKTSGKKAATVAGSAHGLKPATAGKKKKKQNQKQILYEMFDFEYKTGGSGGAGNKSYSSASAAVGNMHHLSHKERAEFESKFSHPKNKSQEKYARFLADNTKKIVIATGPAGTGKTLMATEYAIREFVYGNFEKIIITRPSVAVDEDLGYLPGTLEEKSSPYLIPIYDIFNRFFTTSEMKNMTAEKVVEIAPLGFMRGRTFKNCCIIADEMQNSTISQMKMILTRLGENSRIFITGDLQQKDLVGKMNGLEDFLDKFKRRKRSSSIDSIEFELEDIQREDVVKEVLQIYSSDSEEEAYYQHHQHHHHRHDRVKYKKLETPPPYIDDIERNPDNYI